MYSIWKIRDSGPSSSHVTIMKTMHWMPGFKLTNKCKRIIYILCPNDYVSCTLHAAMLDFQALRKRSTKMNGM